MFHTNISRWFFTGVWVTASLLKSPGLFSVFWPILIMLEWGWSPLVLLFQSLPVLLPILWGLFPVLQLQLVSPSPLCSIVFLVLEQGLDIHLHFAFFWLYSVVCRNGKVHYSIDSLFWLIINFSHLQPDWDKKNKNIFLLCIKASLNPQVSISFKLRPVSSYFKFNRGKNNSYNNTCQKFKHL